MKIIRIKQAGAIAATAIALVTATGIVTSSAQTTPATPAPTQSATQSTPNLNPNQPNPSNRPARINIGAVLACSTTNYDDVAAQALGIQSPALRKALVGGQTLAQIAKTNNVSIDTVNTALKTAYTADLAQAVTSGLITQAQADQITTLLNSASATPNATQNAAPSTGATPDATQSANAPSTQPAAPNGNQNPNGNRGPFGNGGPFGFGPGNMVTRLIQVPRNNTVKTYLVAAKAIGVACPDLIKAVEGGQSIAQVATGKNVQAQTVIDALVTAQKAALAQDVQEGLIGQAQADGATAQLAARITELVNNVPGQRGQGFGGGFPGIVPPGFGGGNNGQPNGGNGQPPAAATTAAINQ